MKINRNVKDFNLAIVDIETTGITLDKEIIEIGLIKMSPYNFAVIDEWEIRIRPQKPESADQEALKITGYNEREWENAVSEEEAIKKFLEKTEGCILIGHNLSFDLMHLTQAIERHKLRPTFWYKSIDTFTLAWQKLRNDPRIRSLSLDELARYFGIEAEPAHRALNDCKTTYKVFLKLISL